MLHFHLTAKLAKTLRVKPEPTHKSDEADWLERWHVRDIPLNAPLDALLFTNAETLYSLVHPFDRRERIDEIVGIFQHRLEYITERDFTSQPDAFRICKTASRRVVGCMNELAMMIEFEAERAFREEGVRFEVIEENLNSGVIGGKFPEKEFAKRLND